MINLLPPEVKEDYRYARKNRHILGWCAAFVLALVGLAIITGTGLIIMQHQMSDYKTRIATAQSDLASQNLSGTEKEVKSISNNLKLMVTVLSKEILFSKLLARLGTITPPNVILTNLAISQTESAVDITAQTRNYDGATQLQVNLADPNNQIFSKADIVNITCSSSTSASDANTNYPCTVSIRALFTSNNPFLFINSGTKAGS